MFVPPQAIGSRLAKTLGKGMNAAAAAIRAMGAEQIAQYEREKAVTVGGVEYLQGEIKVGPHAARLGFELSKGVVISMLNVTKVRNRKP